MNVHLEQAIALKYAATQLEATNALVTLVTNFLQTTKHAVVGVGWFDYQSNPTIIKNMLEVFPFICLDINECLLGTTGCTQICNNTVGSYTCSCNTGLTLNADNQTCVGKHNIFSLISMYKLQVKNCSQQ